MNNNDNYKKTFSNITPSEKSIERVMDITKEKEKRFNISVKKVLAVAMAFAVVITGGFGINYAVDSKKNDFSVMVVYAYDNKSLLFGSKNKQELFYGIYTAPLDDEDACDQVRNRWQNDKSKLLNWIDNERDDGESASISSGSNSCYSTKLDKDTAVFYTLNAGLIELSLEDYTQVKTFKIENESQYGYLELDYCTEEEYKEYFDTEADVNASDGYSEDSKYSENYEITQEDIMKDFGWAHEFELTGDELRFSQNSGFYSKGRGKYEENKGYFLNWTPSFELKTAIGNNPNFDLSQIKDTITFTVEFNDGTVKTASLDLYFDSDGYMHFE